MTRPTFLEGVGVALAASLSGAAAYTALSAAVGVGMLRPVIAGLALGYLVYLLARTPVRVGRVTAFLAWCLAAVGLWVAAPPLALYLLLHVGMLWLIRALFFHASLVSALADLALGLLALAAGLWALAQTGSLLLGLWCFFLVQAGFVAIPPGSAARRPGREPSREDAFEHAHRIAEAALRKHASPL
jgi:ABC-type transport system involved in multi-copper enzyme maturation permease subunit